MSAKPKSYTVAEIDALRSAVRDKILWGNRPVGTGNEIVVSILRAFSVGELESLVEDRLRTHMLAGHTAKDLRNGN